MTSKYNYYIILHAHTHTQSSSQYLLILSQKFFFSPLFISLYLKKNLNKQINFLILFIFIRIIKNSSIPLLYSDYKSISEGKKMVFNNSCVCACV